MDETKKTGKVVKKSTRRRKTKADRAENQKSSESSKGDVDVETPKNAGEMDYSRLNPELVRDDLEKSLSLIQEER